MKNNSEKKRIDSFFQENVAFFVCLLASMIIWTTIKMSEEYTVRDTFGINYHIASAFDFSNAPPHSIDFDKTGTGWSLLKNRTSANHKNINIETIPELGSQYVQRVELIQSILSKLNSSDVKVDNLSMDAIFLEYEKRQTKKVPIKLSGEIKPAPGYIFIDRLSINPGHVVISGSSSLLDTIEYWPTASIGNHSIKDAYNQTVQLVQSEYINLDINEVNAQVSVEQITQKKLRVPIYTDNKNVRLVPDHVEVEFNTGISRFNAIGTEQFSFKVRIDSMNNGLNKNTPVILDKYPGHIIQVRYQPKVVEYLYLNNNVDLSK